MFAKRVHFPPFRVLIPGGGLIVAAVIQWVLDVTCSPYAKVCKNVSSSMAEVYAITFCFLAIVVLTQFERIRQVLHPFWTAFHASVNSNTQTATTPSLRGTKAKAD